MQAIPLTRKKKNRNGPSRNTVGLTGRFYGPGSGGTADDEYTFRFNRRHSRHRDLLFYRLLQQAVATDPHPYAELTADSSAEQAPG